MEGNGRGRKEEEVEVEGKGQTMKGRRRGGEKERGTRWWLVGVTTVRIVCSTDRRSKPQITTREGHPRCVRCLVFVGLGIPAASGSAQQ